MKPTTFATYAIHRTFDKDGKGNRRVTWYISGNETVDFLTPKKITDFLEALQPRTQLRLSSALQDAQVIDLHKRGAQLMYAHWHDLGLEKGASPEEIVNALTTLDDRVLRTLVPREDIIELRNALALRNAIVRCHGDAVRRVKQVGRNMGVMGKDAHKDPRLRPTLEALGEVYEVFQAVSADGSLVSVEKRVEEIAEGIPECRLFNQIAGIKSSWITAASIVAYTGGIDRFEQVSSLWHFLGQHVVDGVAPRRAKGSAITWSPDGRTTVYLLGETIIKNRNNPWRQFFDEAREAEMEVHEQKHPDCPSPDGHCTARAKRKMCKELLKQFFIAAKGQVQTLQK